MKRILFAVGLLVLVISILTISGCDSISGPSAPRNTNNSQQTGIWVTGQGEVSVTPDMAILNLGVEVQADTVAQAYNQAATAMDDIIRSLGDSGVAEEDIRTDYFRIDQELDRRSTGPDVIIGYTVTNIAEVKIRNIDNVSSILGAAVTAGGDYVRVRSFGFTVDDPTIYYDEARKEAQIDAREKAEQIADNAGVELGEATFIAESTSYSPYSIDYGLGIPAPVVITESPTFVSTGQAEVTIIIQVAYNIE